MRICAPKTSGSSICEAAHARRAASRSSALASLPLRRRRRAHAAAPTRSRRSSRAASSRPRHQRARPPVPGSRGHAAPRRRRQRRVPSTRCAPTQRGRYRFAYRRCGRRDAIYFAAAVVSRHRVFHVAAARGSRAAATTAEITVFDTTSSPVPLHGARAAPRRRRAAADGRARHRGGLRDLERHAVTAVGARLAERRVERAAAARARRTSRAAQRRRRRRRVRAARRTRRAARAVRAGHQAVQLHLRAAGDAFPLEIVARPADGVLEVLVEEPGAQVRAASASRQGTATIEGRTSSGSSRRMRRGRARAHRGAVALPRRRGRPWSSALAVAVVLAMIVGACGSRIGAARGAARVVVVEPRESVDSLAARDRGARRAPRRARRVAERADYARAAHALKARALRRACRAERRGIDSPAQFERGRGHGNRCNAGAAPPL